jgi:hypothetical protein
MTLVLVITFSACVAVSAAEFSLNATQVLFEGAVDGSAGADVGGGFFVGATDENNKLRLYDVKGGHSRKTLDVRVDAAVKSALGLKKVKECDLEGAAKIGDLIFWIGSHGRDEHAKEKKERQVLFATKLSGTGKDATLEIAGEIYTKLLDDLVTHPALRPFDLAKAATRAPKDKDALNIESLATDGDKLWIGFRNPIGKDGKALMVPLLNPKEVIEKGGKARLGEPIILNLGGLGFRDMVRWHDSFLIIAGDFVDRFDQEAKPPPRPSRLFSWKPGNEPKHIGVDFGDLNPEAIMILGQGDKSEILILSDDGKYPDRGKEKTFRGVWLEPRTSSSEPAQRTGRRDKPGPTLFFASASTKTSLNPSVSPFSRAPPSPRRYTCRYKSKRMTRRMRFFVRLLINVLGQRQYI